MALLPRHWNKSATLVAVAKVTNKCERVINYDSFFFFFFFENYIHHPYDLNKLPIKSQNLTNLPQSPLTNPNTKFDKSKMKKPTMLQQMKFKKI